MTKTTTIDPREVLRRYQREPLPGAPVGTPYTDDELRARRNRVLDRLDLAKAACRDGDLGVLERLGDEAVECGILSAGELEELREAAAIRSAQVSEENAARELRNRRRSLRESVAAELARWHKAEVAAAIEAEVERRLARDGEHG